MISPALYHLAIWLTRSFNPLHALGGTNQALTRAHHCWLSAACLVVVSHVTPNSFISISTACFSFPSGIPAFLAQIQYSMWESHPKSQLLAAEWWFGDLRGPNVSSFDPVYHTMSQCVILCPNMLYFVPVYHTLYQCVINYPNVSYFKCPTLSKCVTLCHLSITRTQRPFPLLKSSQFSSSSASG